MATDMARRMVTEWGMSDKLGPLHYGQDQEEVFLGHSIGHSKTMSEGTASQVDTEIRLIVEEAYAKAHQILTTCLDDLHKLARALLEYETLNGDEIKAIMRGEPIIRDSGNDEPMDSRPRSSVPTGGGLGGLPQGA
jgi:cell division protease FtsH